MKYPIAIEPGDDTHAFGVVVPDLPGCFSAGDTLEEAIDNSKEAIVLWMETVVEDGLAVPEPSSMARLTADPEFSGWLWAVVEIDAAILDSKTERVNISVPRRVLAMIDRYVLNHGGTRSGFLANAALDKIMHVSILSPSPLPPSACHLTENKEMSCGSTGRRKKPAAGVPYGVGNGHTSD